MVKYQIQANKDNLSTNQIRKKNQIKKNNNVGIPGAEFITYSLAVWS